MHMAESGGWGNNKFRGINKAAMFSGTHSQECVDCMTCPIKGLSCKNTEAKHEMVIKDWTISFFFSSISAAFIMSIVAGQRAGRKTLKELRIEGCCHCKHS